MKKKKEVIWFTRKGKTFLKKRKHGGGK